RGRYDCIVVSLTGRLRLLLAFAAARVSRTPVVLWVGIWHHPTTYAHRLSRPFVARLYRRADAIAVYGVHVARHIERESGRTERVFEGAQAVDNEAFREAIGGQESRPSDSGLLIGFLGRLEPEKGVDVLIAALRSSPNVRLSIAGSGSQLEALTT